MYICFSHFHYQVCNVNECLHLLLHRHVLYAGMDLIAILKHITSENVEMVSFEVKGAGGGGPLPKILNFNFIAFLDRVDLPLYPSFFRM